MDLINISLANGITVALIGYIVVFIGLILLMIVVTVMAKIFIMKDSKVNSPKEALASTAAASASKDVISEEIDSKAADDSLKGTREKLPKAEGSAGELKLYDTDPRDAAMIMAIVADNLGVPLNELRFKSIREVM